MGLTKEQLKAIADKSNELDLRQLDKYILCDVANCSVFDDMNSVDVVIALDEAYKEIRPTDENNCLGRNEARTWSTIIERALVKLLTDNRTEEQKGIGSWITKNVSTEALDKYIKVQLAEYPGFGKFDETDVLNAIETVYLEIEPEEQYDLHIWTTVVERALAMLEPNKNKKFKVEFKDFGDYVQEMIVGPNWITYYLSVATEEKCFRMGINDYIEDTIDFDNDEDVPCVITRIS